MRILDSTGKLLAETPPCVLTGTFCRAAHSRGAVTRKNEEQYTLETSDDLIRMQVPWLVTLLNYDSELQLTAHETEFYVYAPPKQSVAVKLAFELWRYWWKDAPMGRAMTPMESVMFPEWPKVSDGAVAEMLDDDTFIEMWKFASRKGESKRKVCDGIVSFTPGYLAAGHPEDPFAFTDMSGDVRIYRTGDFQNGMDIRI